MNEQLLQEEHNPESLNNGFNSYRQFILNDVQKTLKSVLSSTYNYSNYSLSDDDEELIANGYYKDIDKDTIVKEIVFGVLSAVVMS